MIETMENPIPVIDESVYHEPYVIKDGCLCERIKVKEQVIEVKLADFVPVLKAEITLDDGAEQRKLFRVAGTYKDGTVLPEQIVSADEMQSMKWLLQRWGQYGAVIPRQNVLGKISHAILLTRQEVRNETVFLQTGWHEFPDGYVFLMPNENCDTQMKVELQGKLDRYRFTVPCEIDDLIYLSAMLENSFAPQRIVLPMLALTFLCPLNHFLKIAGYEPKFVAVIIGKTGCRKSSLAALFCSFYGSFTASDLPMSFHDTANSILADIYYLKDVLTCIDDFHPSGMYKEQEMREIAQCISRYYGDRSGRGRMNSRLEKENAKPPMGNAIVTSESTLGLCESGEARYFYLELDESDIVLNEFSEYQKIARQNILSGMMMRYVDWIKEKYLYDAISFSDMLSEKFESYREMFIRKLSERGIKVHTRTPDMLAHLKIGFEFLLQFLFDSEQIGEQDIRKYAETFDELLLQNTAANSEIIIRENPVNVFCEKIKSLLDSGRCYTEPRGSGAQRQKNCIGLHDDSSYYLFMDTAHSEVRKLCAEQGEHFTIKKNDLLKQLRKEGLIESKTSKNTISIRENSTSVVNVTVIDRSKLNDRLCAAVCPPADAAVETVEL
ncbi:hypothetical protein SAMN02910317_02850 [Ruminococcaceae bacterium FB2012]|nr:hypothetical protein SAMN02910317_02850 [Ruminococcaceae bacterium FB2012]